MNEVVFEHVPVAELPERWRARLAKAGNAWVTVRLEQEVMVAPIEDFTTDDPAFGIWRDHEDIANVAAYARRLRRPRYHRSG